MINPRPLSDYGGVLKALEITKDKGWPSDRNFLLEEGSPIKQYCALSDDDRIVPV